MVIQHLHIACIAYILSCLHLCRNMMIKTSRTEFFSLNIQIPVELEPTLPISESSYAKMEEFFLFSTLMEATMIDRKLSDKPIHFELSIGNAGNSIDGHNESQCSNLGEGGELEVVDSTAFNSMTNSCKPISHDKLHFYLPYWDYKPCMNVRCHFPDLRRRMYNSNMIAKLADAMVSIFAIFISANEIYLCLLFITDRKKGCTKRMYSSKRKTLEPK